MGGRGYKGIRNCIICGNDFLVRTDKIDTAKYCSRKCLYISLDKTSINTCVTCGNSFKAKQCEKERKYCSKECFYSSGDSRPNRRKSKFTYNCLICDVLVSVYPSRMKRNPKYCSHRCNAISQIMTGMHRSSIELKVEQKLNELNIQYIHSYPLGGKVFDFLLTNTRILLEIDGVFWHAKNYKLGLQEFDALHEIQKVVVKNDTKKNKISSSNNFELIRIWEDEIDTFNFKRLT
jgi:very-short-patch-repair endonuclease